MMRETSFNPEMLTLARQARELTQGELAERSRLSQARLSKIENGLVVPTTDVVEVLARALDYPRDFFFQEGHNYAPPVWYHRKRKVSQKLLDRVHAEINIRAHQLKRLLRSITFDAELPLPKMDPDEYESIGYIAGAVRSVWRLPRGPVGNLVRLLERAGVLIVPMRWSVAEVDAVTQLIPGMPPLIFVNEDAPMDRLRFTLAHELGHLVMHEVPNAEMEAQANWFAAEFLMPHIDIAQYLTRVSLPLLASLKRVWRVSMAALLETARRLGTVTERQYIRLRSELSARGYIKREPPELDVPREEPEMVRRIVAFHLNDLGYGIDDLAKLIIDFPERVRAQYLAPVGQSLRLVG